MLSSARKDNLIYMWDIRLMTKYVKFFSRSNFTNQRLFFDNYNGKLMTGDDQNNLFLFDINEKKCIIEQNIGSLVNDVSFLDKNNALICLGKRQLRFKQQVLGNMGLKKLDSEVDELDFNENLPIIDPAFRKYFPITKRKSDLMIKKVEVDEINAKFICNELINSEI
jgi:WD40 repeat protein